MKQSGARASFGRRGGPGGSWARPHRFGGAPRLPGGAAGGRTFAAQKSGIHSPMRSLGGSRGGWTVSRVASCYTHAEAARPRNCVSNFRCVILDNAGGTRTDVTSHPPRPFAAELDRAQHGRARARDRRSAYPNPMLVGTITPVLRARLRMRRTQAHVRASSSSTWRHRSSGHAAAPASGGGRSVSNAASKLGAAEDDAIAETPQPRSHSRRAHGVPPRSLERTNQAKQSNAARAAPGCLRVTCRTTPHLKRSATIPPSDIVRSDAPTHTTRRGAGHGRTRTTTTAAHGRTHRPDRRC